DVFDVANDQVGFGEDLVHLLLGELLKRNHGRGDAPGTTTTAEALDACRDLEAGDFFLLAVRGLDLRLWLGLVGGRLRLTALRFDLSRSCRRLLLFVVALGLVGRLA